MPAASRTLVALSALDDPCACALQVSLARTGREVETLTPLAMNPGGWVKARRRRWRSVDLDGRGNRLARAMLPAAFFEPGRQVVVVNDLRRFVPARPAIAIALWSHFAHPRQQLGASIGDQASGLVAEIALAAPAALYIVAASWQGKPMAVVSADMIATELVGLAIGQMQADPDREIAGPWEHPLVQRATELDLGARLPSDIVFRSQWLGPASSLAADFAGFSARIAARIGIANLVD